MPPSDFDINLLISLSEIKQISVFPKILSYSLDKNSFLPFHSLKRTNIEKFKSPWPSPCSPPLFLPSPSVSLHLSPPPPLHLPRCPPQFLPSSLTSSPFCRASSPYSRSTCLLLAILNSFFPSFFFVLQRKLYSVATN